MQTGIVHSNINTFYTTAVTNFFMNKKLASDMPDKIFYPAILLIVLVMLIFIKTKLFILIYQSSGFV